jgi:hypothetical protein
MTDWPTSLKNKIRNIGILSDLVEDNDDNDVNDNFGGISENQR